MLLNRWTSVAIAATFLIADVGLASAAQAAPDPTYPTGSFTIRTPTEYIYDPDGWRPEHVFLDVERLSLSDDTTPAADIVVKLYSGTDVAFSTNGAQWSYGSPAYQMLYGGAMNDDPIPPYHLAGTYHAYVTLTDSDGHATTIDLPTVTLLEDNTGPVTRLTLPRPRLRHTVASWRYLHATTIDAGINRPATNDRPEAEFIALQKRHGFFYFFDPKTKRFKKGLRTVARTYAKFDVHNFVVWVGTTSWRSPYLRGLSRGRLWVSAGSTDYNLNEGNLIDVSYLLTRRR